MISEFVLRLELSEWGALSHYLGQNNSVAQLPLSYREEEIVQRFCLHEQMFSYVVRIPSSDTIKTFTGYHDHMREIHAWTTERFGARCPYRPETESSEGAWTALASLFMFKDKDNAFEFKVRWG